MVRKVPKPRIGDIVETLDFSKMAGKIVGFHPPSKVRVRWSVQKFNKKGMAIGWKHKVEIENIKDLALVSRPKQFSRLKKVI